MLVCTHHTRANTQAHTHKQTLHIHIQVVTSSYSSYPALPKITAIEPNAPTIRRGPNNDFVLPEGQLGTVLSCTAFGAPPPHIMWVTAEGMSLPDHVTSVTSSIESHDPNYVTAQLKWRRGFSASDVNSYKCVATNSIGNESLAVTLTTGTNNASILYMILCIH